MNRKRALAAAQVAYLVALIGVAAWLLRDRGPAFRHMARGARPAFLVLDLALLCFQVVFSAAIWQRALAVFGERQPFGFLLRTVGRTLPTRYLPGGIWLPATRGSILRRRGVALPTVSAAALLDQALALVAGLVLGAFALAATGDLAARLPLLAVIGVIGALVCSPPALHVVQRVVARGADVTRARAAGYGPLVVAVVAYTLWSGLTFALYVAAFPGVDVPPLRAAGAYLVAWVLGYVAVLAPQGAGVADLAMAAMLTNGAVAPLALLIAGFRVVVIVRDVIVASVATLQRDQ